MTDIYSCFEELRLAEEPAAFTITTESDGRSSQFAIIAPHGGGIEPATSLLAREIAGDEFCLYLFEGRLKVGNRRLHITSHNFDEPRALQLIANCHSVIALHGCRDTVSTSILIGGRHDERGDQVSTSLVHAGFDVAAAPAGLAARDPNNICNRGRDERGLQLELPASLRRELQDDAVRRGTLVECVRKVLMEFG